MSVYYEMDDQGEWVEHEYEAGDIVSGKRSTLPGGRYQTVRGVLIRLGDSVARSHYGGSDQLGEGVKGLWNPQNGKMYDSKSQYHADIKAAGCHIVDDPFTPPPSPPVHDWRPDVARAYEQLSPSLKGKKK